MRNRTLYQQDSVRTVLHKRVRVALVAFGILKILAARLGTGIPESESSKSREHAETDMDTDPYLYFC